MQTTPHISSVVIKFAVTHSNPCPASLPPSLLLSLPPPLPSLPSLPPPQTSLHIAEYNLLQWLQLTFPSSIPEGVLPQKGVGHSKDSNRAKIVAVEEEEEEEGSDGITGQQDCRTSAVGDPDRDRPLFPGVQ